MEPQRSGRKILGKVLSLLLLLALLAGGYLLFRSLGFTDLTREELSQALESYGAAAPLIFMLLSFLQVTFIPIPSTVTILAGSYLFGAWESFLYSYVGIVLGSLFAFFLGRVLGKRFVCYMAGDPERVEALLLRTKNKETVVFFFMFLFPAFPDDLLCLLAGILPIGFPAFLFMQLITRVTSIGTTLFFFSGEVIPFSGWGIPVMVGAVLVGLTAFLLSFRYADALTAAFDRMTSRIASFFARKRILPRKENIGQAPIGEESGGETRKTKETEVRKKRDPGDPGKSAETTQRRDDP